LPQCDLIPNDLSLWGMFLQADIVVKSVIIGLALASVWSWSIIFGKWFMLRILHRKGNAFLERFRSQGSFDVVNHGLATSGDPFAQLFSLLLREWGYMREKKIQPEDKEFWYQRVGQLMGVSIENQRLSLQKHMGFLASVGATAPFVGLFGTVWGIMHSFQCIAMTKNTNLSVVAPGIAEALFATAVGLIVAIPAVIAYNRLTLDINRYMTRLENFSQELSAFCLRQLVS